MDLDLGVSGMSSWLLVRLPAAGHPSLSMAAELHLVRMVAGGFHLVREVVGELHLVREVVGELH